MNCKQGDRAIVVKSTARNLGKIVKCVSFIPDFLFEASPNLPEFKAAAWVIDPPLPSWRGGLAQAAPDSWLKPLPPEEDVANYDTKLELVIDGKS